MKIAILSRNKKLYSTQRLVEAGQQRGHDMHVIDPLRCYMNINSIASSIHFEGEVLEGFDAIIPRIGASITFYGTAVLRQFETIGVFSINESVASIPLSRQIALASTSGQKKHRPAHHRLCQ